MINPNFSRSFFFKYYFFLNKKKINTRGSTYVKKPVKSKLSNLTKKQLKRIKIKKLSKLIWPRSSEFSFCTKKKRSQIVIKDDFNYSYFLVHDGYSWQKTYINQNFNHYKFGFFCFKTRPTSPISVFDKGKWFLNMKQKSTYKIKGFKVKRKK